MVMRAKVPLEMTMPFKGMVSSIALCVLSAHAADKAHEVFELNKETILAAPVTVLEGQVYVVGETVSPKNRGDAVGWSLAEANAKWNIGERHFATAAWPEGLTEDEKTEAWKEYRLAHPEHFSVVGFQRIWTQKPSSEEFRLVISFPAEFVDLTPPSAAELAACVKAAREHRKRAEEAARKQAEESSKQKAAEESARRNAEEEAKRKAGYREVKEDGSVQQQQLDEDLIN